MTLFEEAIQELLQRNSRFTQDTPVMPEVWRRFSLIAEDPEVSDGDDGRVDLIFTPHRQSSASQLLCYLAVQLMEFLSVKPNRRSKKDWLAPYELSASETHVVAKMTLPELVAVAIPLSAWWSRHTVRNLVDCSDVAVPLEDYLKSLKAKDANSLAKKAFLKKHERPQRRKKDEQGLSDAALWFLEMVGLVQWRGGRSSDGKVNQNVCRRKAMEVVTKVAQSSAEPHLWIVGCNREIEMSIRRSVPAVKADASHVVFKPDTSRISWAIVDSGIDATHPAFRRKDSEGGFYPKPFARDKNQTRIVASYDFTKLRSHLSLTALDLSKNISQISGAFSEKANQLRRALANGRLLNWEELLDEIEVGYDERRPETGRPVTKHGTHVAGILGADWPGQSQGVCPAINLYDLRVVDDNGMGDEFSLIAALQFIRFKNSMSDQPVIHGANISMSLTHDVRNFACGQTPICEEADRLVSSGVVVVAAAGNNGFARFVDDSGIQSDGYRGGGITDPGNCESVITVGATHRHQPHKYGISFFSSRGPTGDGRLKPDLVAPGEKITSTVPGEDEETMDGTSMAAPHVSGAAALILARHREFIGAPEKIKSILCDTATDLGRVRDFQGAGMLDILRALQSI